MPMVRPSPPNAMTSTPAIRQPELQQAVPDRIELETVQQQQHSSSPLNEARPRSSSDIEALSTSDILPQHPYPSHKQGWKKHLLFNRTWQNIAVLIACLIAFGSIFYAVRSYDLSVWTAKKDFWQQCKDFEDKDAQCPFKPPPHVRKRTRRAIEYFLITVCLCLSIAAISSGLYSIYRHVGQRKRRITV